jgi:hypothetical protein
MAGPTKREIRDQDVQGLKCLRKIRPLLSRLRKVGTERDRAGNRRLFMDQYCSLILMSLFSPMIQSLRDLQRACALDKVRKRLGVTRDRGHGHAGQRAHGNRSRCRCDQRRDRRTGVDVTAPYAS